jgi:hypothetical protein
MGAVLTVGDALAAGVAAGARDAVGVWTGVVVALGRSVAVASRVAVAGVAPTGVAVSAAGSVLGMSVGEGVAVDVLPPPGGVRVGPGRGVAVELGVWVGVWVGVTAAVKLWPGVAEAVRVG